MPRRSPDVCYFLRTFPPLSIPYYFLPHPPPFLVRGLQLEPPPDPTRCVSSSIGLPFKTPTRRPLRPYGGALVARPPFPPSHQSGRSWSHCTRGPSVDGGGGLLGWRLFLPSHRTFYTHIVHFNSKIGQNDPSFEDVFLFNILASVRFLNFWFEMYVSV